MSLTAARLACAILAGDHNLHHEPDPHATAMVEAEAFIANAQPHVPTLTIAAVAFTESRFSPTGSETDRDQGMWGVMQIDGYTLRCWSPWVRDGWKRDPRHPRSRRLVPRFVRHDDPARCTDPAIIAERARLLDPATNIRLGAGLLELRYAQLHAQHHDASVYRDWVGAYFWGSAPPAHGHRRVWIRVRRYAARVHANEALLRARVARCME